MCLLFSPKQAFVCYTICCNLFLMLSLFAARVLNSAHVFRNIKGVVFYDVQSEDTREPKWKSREPHLARLQRTNANTT